MLSEEEWRQLLASVPAPNCDLEVVTFYKAVGTASRPARVGCSDGQQYWIKGPQLAKVPFNEQVVAALGVYLDAPIPVVRVARLNNALRLAEPQLSHIPAALVHASRLEEGCTERLGIAYSDEPGNRSRFAALALLFTWAYAHDHQLIYKNSDPHLVFSVDHGHFFCGPNWQRDQLSALPLPPQLDGFFGPVRLTAVEIAPVLDRLQAVTAIQIASAVAAPPASWSVTPDERVALCIHLERRREHTLQLRRGI